MSKDYKKAIIDSLLKKYTNRTAKKITTDRRILLKPTEVYRDYGKNNADLTEKQALNEAVLALEQMAFVTAQHLKYSDDIEKIYLSTDKIDAIYEYLRESYDVIPQSTVLRQVQEIIKPYLDSGSIVQKLCDQILTKVEDPRCVLDPDRIEANLKIVRFLEKNREPLYVREVSMLVYGDSKWFENNNYEEICTFLRTATEMPKEEGVRNDAVLGAFYVSPAEQDIFLKGKWIITWEKYTLELSKLPGGIAITSGDMQRIKNIKVDADHVMTIENKTSFQRMKGTNTAMMYLGGFANRHQVEFLSKVITDNPAVSYQHFGDIDIGGFLIHKHLCRETNKYFELYCMGIPQLKDQRFRHCLRELTEHDHIRLAALMEDGVYREVLRYMKEHNEKLEQEIVSYYLEKN